MLRMPFCRCKITEQKKTEFARSFALVETGKLWSLDKIYNDLITLYYFGYSELGIAA